MDSADPPLVAIAFTLDRIANFVALAVGKPPAWVTYSPLLPLGVLLFTGLYLFVLPMPRRGVARTRIALRQPTDAPRPAMSQTRRRPHEQTKQQAKRSSRTTRCIAQALQARFEKNMNRHKGLGWAEVQARLDANTERLLSLSEMERTGGEPDVVGPRSKDGRIHLL